MSGALQLAAAEEEGAWRDEGGEDFGACELCTTLCQLFVVTIY